VIAIVDTGGANLASVRYALERLGRSGEITVDPKVISAATHVILPGVGAALHSMERLHRHELTSCLTALKAPTLGICLGMQLLFARSAEGDTECLGILRGEVKKMEPEDGRIVPHMGWNRLRSQGDPSPLLQGISSDSYFYFVHSYVAPFGPWVRAAFDYGGKFPAVVESGNFHGVQFHPERSAEPGAQLLKNFLSL
jgi:glutamine amidotransferase